MGRTPIPRATKHDKSRKNSVLAIRHANDMFTRQEWVRPSPRGSMSVSADETSGIPREMTKFRNSPIRSTFGHMLTRVAHLA